MYSHASAHSHTNVVHVCLTFLSLPDYLNSHCFAKQRTIKLHPFLNLPFLHRVPTPGSTPPLKEFEREALICWVRFSTAHTFLSLFSLSFFLSQGHYKPWHIPRPEVLEALQLGQEQHVCYPQITRLPPASRKAPNAVTARRAAGEPAAAEAPIKTSCGGSQTPASRRPAGTCRAAVGTETVPACGRGSVWPARPCHWSLKGGLSGHGLAAVLRGLYGAQAATFFFFFFWYNPSPRLILQSWELYSYKRKT